jgi:site-specific DNA-methyltransferase (adenine-specific)
MRPYYEQDGITIYHGDCFDMAPLAASADCLITSPPYNCGMDYGSTHDDQMHLSVYLSWLEDRYSSWAASLQSGAFVCLNVPSWIGSRDEQVFAFDEYKAIADRCLPFWDLVIWEKSPPNGTAWGNYANSPRIRANHEWVLIHRATGKSRGHSDVNWQDWSRLTQSVWSINPSLPFYKEHPATFPAALPARLTLLFSPAGGMVVDPFCGTGTTLVAARSLGRKAIGIEINEAYCEIAAKRLSQGALPLEVA